MRVEPATYLEAEVAVASAKGAEKDGKAITPASSPSPSPSHELLDTGFSSSETTEYIHRH